MLFDSFEAYDVQETRRISRAEGKTEGKIEGKIEGRIESILELLSDLGTIPANLEEQILAEQNPETLSSWLKLAAKAQSIEEFQVKSFFEYHKKQMT